MTEDIEKNLESEIKKRRAGIDEIDSALLQLIARRKDIAIEIAKIKQKIGSEDDEVRLKEVFTRLEKRAEELELKPDKIRLIWKDLIKYMIEEQMDNYPY